MEASPGGRLVYLVLGILSFGALFRGFCQDEESGVFIVTLKQAPSSKSINFSEELRKKGRYGPGHGFHHGSSSSNSSRLHKSRNVPKLDPHNSSYISRVHDALLRRKLKGGKYIKLYSYHYLINGFAVLVTPEQASKLSRRREVENVVLDFSVRTATTHTPQFLGLAPGACPRESGFNSAGEWIIIGFIDTGIDPTHRSFSDRLSKIFLLGPATGRFSFWYL